MGSNVIATCKEVCAVAPAITDIDLAVITRLPDTQRLGIVTYGSWSRRAIETTPWRTPDDALRFLDIGTDVACSGRTTASGNLSTSVTPLDIRQIPGLADLLETTIDDGHTNPIAELDHALTSTTESADTPTYDDPYAPIPFNQWIHHTTAGQSPRNTAPTPIQAATVPTTLSPGQTLPLPDDAAYQLDVTFQHSGSDADMTLLLLEHTGRVGTDDDFVFYNQPTGSDGAIRLHNKYSEGPTHTERATVHLSALPPRVTTVVISINMDVDAGHTCAELSGAELTISTPQNSWTFTPPADPNMPTRLQPRRNNLVRRHRNRILRLLPSRPRPIPPARGGAGYRTDRVRVRVRLRLRHYRNRRRRVRRQRLPRHMDGVTVIQLLDCVFVL
ncbi:TerD family protein [Rhodococcoides kyotonense]|uniref:TerD domain-containing protein n=1 Tax=Rhodococcoides kyotonense TaxID=398843 RepID=A0A239MYK7_9NOCA|nr:TerD family protein [Rhodococcus kyotonensis]SNT47600.1 TerD domain-containing protein [Rhodococcus kyotonensis]